MSEWDRKRNEEEGLDPSNLTKHSAKAAHWDCGAPCGHHKWKTEIRIRTRIRTSEKLSGCPYCAGRKKCPCEMVNKALPEILPYWDYELNDDEGLFVDEIPSSSLQKVNLKCLDAKCDHHKWKARVHLFRNGARCPFCAGQKTCPCDSFMSLYPEIGKEFHPHKNSDIDPYTISVSSSKKLWWLCAKGHEWEVEVYNRTYKNSRCSTCARQEKSKLEKKCYVILEKFSKVYFFEFDDEIKFDDLRNPFTGYKLRFDFIIEGYNYIILIEIDGEQHFQFENYSGSWKDKHRQFKDDLKTMYCLDNNIHLLRISFSEIENMEQIIKEFLYDVENYDGEESLIQFKGKEYGILNSL
jgi:hypothetical protein